MIMKMQSIILRIKSNNSPTKIRSKKSLELATKLVYANKGKPYEDSFNPYPENTLDHARFKRFYEKKCNFYHYMEDEFEHMAQAYGEFRPDKLTK